MNNSQPDLWFCPGEQSGWTSAGLAGSHDLQPDKIVRELLQNSLDAASEAERDEISIRFEVEEHDMGRIPGIDSYRRVFGRVVQDQEKLFKDSGLSDPAAAIQRTIEECLRSSRCETLFVLDNGIGLDKKRMAALLGDGMSAKGAESAGAVGVGHLTLLPASDLRYVLYGGRTGDGQTIGAGHAVLAAHRGDDGKCIGKDGYYVRELQQDFFDPYLYPGNDEIPDYIKDKLEWIAESRGGGTGTVVAVPGFNRFREDDNRKSLWDRVSKAAACNFAVAFMEKNLRLELRESGDKKTLDKSSLAATLERFSEEKRTRGGFLSGSRAFDVFKTMTEGKPDRIDTDAGSIPVRLRRLPQGDHSRIELFRNGMWITGDLPRLQRSRFAKCKPFHCVILLNAADGEIYKLVRKSEGPLHNGLENRKLLSLKEKKRMNDAMKALCSRINEEFRGEESEELIVEDVLTVSLDRGSSGGLRPGLVGPFQEIRRRSRFPQSTQEDSEEAESGLGSSRRERKGKGGGVNEARQGRGEFRRAGNAVQFSALFIPAGKRACCIDLKPVKAAPGSEVRFALDESLDESCDFFGSEEFVGLKNVKIDGGFADERLLISEKGRTLAVRLGPLDPQRTIRIEFNYELPQGIDLPDDAPVVLKAQLIRRSPDF